MTSGYSMRQHVDTGERRCGAARHRRGDRDCHAHLASRPRPLEARRHRARRRDPQPARLARRRRRRCASSFPRSRRSTAEVREAGWRDCVLLGMGGSSLCPEVLRSSFGSADGQPTLHVLDTTDPLAIARVTGSDRPGQRPVTSCRASRARRSRRCRTSHTSGSVTAAVGDDRPGLAFHRSHGSGNIACRTPRASAGSATSSRTRPTSVGATRR